MFYIVPFYLEGFISYPLSSCLRFKCKFTQFLNHGCQLKSNPCTVDVHEHINKFYCISNSLNTKNLCTTKNYWTFLEWHRRGVLPIWHVWEMQLNFSSGKSAKRHFEWEKHMEGNMSPRHRWHSLLKSIAYTCRCRLEVFLLIKVPFCWFSFRNIDFYYCFDIPLER